MFKQLINNKFEDIDYKDINHKNITMGLISYQELLDNNNSFQFDIYSINEITVKDNSLNGSIIDYDDYSFGNISIVDFNDILGVKDEISFFIKENFFLIINTNDNIIITKIFNDIVDRINNTKVRYQITLSKLISSFFSRLVTNDNIELSKLEKEVNLLEDIIDKPESYQILTKKLLIISRKMNALRFYYEQLISISQDLIENPNELFTSEKLIDDFDIFLNRANHLADNVIKIRDYLIQIRDASQSYINVKMNETMKVLTVVTTIFLPLTLIAGWYGMNFKNMPELSSRYGYPIIIIVSIIIVLLSIVFYKKKNILWINI